MAQTDHLAYIEELRSSLPAKLIAKLYTKAAVTGQLPKMDDDGNVLPDADEVGGKDRMAALKHLMETTIPKVPTAPQNLPSPSPRIDDVAKKGLENLSNEELDELIYRLEHPESQECPSLPHQA